MSIPENGRESLKELLSVAKKKCGKDIVSMEEEHRHILGALKSEDAKARKNAAILLGAIGFPAQETLIQAIKEEQTQFVIPSMLLTLGKLKGEEAHEFLKNYQPKATVDKHRSEEQSALTLALKNFETAKPEKPNILNQQLFLLTARGHSDLTAEELEERGYSFNQHKQLEDCLTVKLPSLKELMKIRTFMNALISLGRCSVAEVPKFFSSRQLFNRLKGIFDEKTQLNYRLEIAGDKISKEEHVKLMAGIVESLPHYLNNPSAYSFEILCMVKGEDVFSFVKLPQAFDTRFQYRKNALPASINPTTAAAIMRYSYPYLKRDGNVLDAFCGTGTMLIERAKLKPAGALLGVDFSKEAVTFARENAAIAKVNAKFLQSDILKMEKKSGFDEVISNMPFGHRVSSHAQNKDLYEGFVEKLFELLNNNGRAFLYTNDKVLLRDTLKFNGHFKTIDEAVFASGNIHASLFIIQKN